MATRTFTGPGNFEDATKWDGGVSVPAVSDDLVITVGTCTLNGNDANVYGTVTISSGITFDIGVYNFSCGLVTHTGPLKIGTSTGTGLTCAGLSSAVAATLDLQIASIINNSGDVSWGATNVFLTATRGIFTQTASANFSFRPAPTQSFRTIVIDSGVTLTSASNGTQNLADQSTISFTLNGTLATTSVRHFQIGCALAGSITIGSSADVTGAGILYTKIQNSTSIVNNKTGAFSITGSARLAGSGTNNMVFPGWDFSNANVIIEAISTSSGTRYIGASGATNQTLKCKSFTVTNQTLALTLNSSNYNPVMHVSESITFPASNFTYVKGTGTWNMLGSSGTFTIDLQGQTIGPLYFNCAGATRNLVSNGSTASLSGIGGAIQSSVSGTQRILTALAAGTCSGLTFKDISMGAAKKVNAKASCVNLGNNLGIIFKDRFRLN